MIAAEKKAGKTPQRIWLILQPGRKISGQFFHIKFDNWSSTDSQKTTNWPADLRDLKIMT
jgi:hypothetical protein